MKSAGALSGGGAWSCLRLCAVVLCACGDAAPEGAGDAGFAAVGGGASGQASADAAGNGALAGAGAPDDRMLADAPHEEDGLPIVHLWVDPNVSELGYTPARLVYRGHAYQGVLAKHRGKTSLTYPKKNFTMKLTKPNLFDEPEHGMLGRRRIVLTTTFDDNAYVRQRLAFALWNRLQPQIEVHAFNALLYLNGQYHGLYLVGDHVDDERMEASGLWPGGNLYKARSHDANLSFEDWSGDPKDPLERGYTKEEGEPAHGEAGAFDDLHALFAWLADTPDDQLVAELDGVLDRDDFEAWRVLVSAIDATDSAGKNGYLYHDPRGGAPDPRWHYVPWDFNASFGQEWQTSRLRADRSLDHYDHYNALFERSAAIPELDAAYAQRFRSALAGSLSRAAVLALFDAYSDEVAAAAERDEAVWGQAMREFDWLDRDDPFTTHAEERAYVRAWIAERWQRLEERFGR